MIGKAIIILFVVAILASVVYVNVEVGTKDKACEKWGGNCSDTIYSVDCGRENDTVECGWGRGDAPDNN